VCSDLSVYERLVQAGFRREKKREKSDKERTAISGLEFWNACLDIGPMPADRATLAGSL
jgi:hypothetical protein